jgi:enoyl-CoA hydratase/carnithine racemase
MAEPGPLCIYEKRDPHIAIIKLNRPEKKNAISRDLYWALDAAWQKAKADDDVWSIILTGSADAFCVGGDLKENIAFARGEMRTTLRPAAVLEHARLANAQTDHRRDQWLRGGRRF